MRESQVPATHEEIYAYVLQAEYCLTKDFYELYKIKDNINIYTINC